MKEEDETKKTKKDKQFDIKYLHRVCRYHYSRDGEGSEVSRKAFHRNWLTLVFNKSMTKMFTPCQYRFE